MVIILEGLDGAGKTTVVDLLKGMLVHKAVYVKETNPGPDVQARIQSLAHLKSRVESKTLYIYDRCTCIDDWIYEPVMAKKASIFQANCSIFEEINNLLHKCLIIHINVKPEEAMDRLQIRGDEYLAEEPQRMLEQLKALQAAYAEFYKTMLLYPFEVDGAKDATLVSRAVKFRIEDWINTEINKTFKLAHIVPLNYFHLTASNTYHMCLAHLVKEDPNYRQFYRRCVQKGHYVLMDNGAAEGSQLSLEELAQCYEWVRPTEMVLRDSLCNRAETFEKTKEMIEYFKEKGIKCKFMAVPQGQCINEWCDSAEELIQLPEVNTLGISKFLTIQTGEYWARYTAVDYVAYLRKEYGRLVEVHLLGCDSGVQEVDRIRKEYSFVRGCDTALAEIFTKAGKQLEYRSERPAAEIDFLGEPLDITHQQLLLRNMNRFNLMCSVNNEKSSELAWIPEQN